MPRMKGFGRFFAGHPVLYLCHMNANSFGREPHCNGPSKLPTKGNVATSSIIRGSYLSKFPTLSRLLSCETEGTPLCVSTGRSPSCNTTAPRRSPPRPVTSLGVRCTYLWLQALHSSNHLVTALIGTLTLVLCVALLRGRNEFELLK